MDAGKASPKDERVRLEEAIEYAKRALALDDTDPNCHKWCGARRSTAPFHCAMMAHFVPALLHIPPPVVVFFVSRQHAGRPPRSPYPTAFDARWPAAGRCRFAIPSGAMSSHVSLNEKLVCGKVFKQHIDRCIELDPTNAGSYNLVGRWSFEVVAARAISRGTDHGQPHGFRNRCCMRASAQRMPRRCRVALSRLPGYRGLRSVPVPLSSASRLRQHTRRLWISFSRQKS